MNNSNKVINMIFKMIGESGKEELEDYISFYNEDDFLDISFSDFNDSLNKLSNQESKSLTNYSGLQARYINPYLRNGWSYEILGRESKEKKLEIENDIENISNIIRSLSPINKKIKSYRGVTIDYFSSYGISSLEELMSLKGKYFYDSGFVSTSINRDTSFFGKKILNGKVCDIEITYLIDGNYCDGVFLGNLSMSPEQNEYLLNKGSISKIVDVKIENDRAYVLMALVPSLFLEELNVKKSFKNR